MVRPNLNKTNWKTNYAFSKTQLKNKWDGTKKN